MDQRKSLFRALTAILLTVALVCSQAAAGAPAPAGKIRTHYIAADEVEWNYTPSGRDEAMGMPFDAIAKGFTLPGPHQIGSVNKKAIYREYTDATFTTLKPRPSQEAYLGVVGPILHAEVGDTIRVVFKNNAAHPYSMHPHGVLYAKDRKERTITIRPAALTRPTVASRPERFTPTLGACPPAPGLVRAIRARSSGCTIRTATSCATWPPVCSVDLSSPAAAWRVRTDAQGRGQGIRHLLHRNQRE